MITLITGGARSGKSSFASSLFENSKNVVYIASMRIEDEETKSRVFQHKKSRPESWRTFEDSYNLNEAVGEELFYILDCVTTLSSNILFDMSKNSPSIDAKLQNEIENAIFLELDLLIKKARSQNADLL
jgi:adenosylcobinamide kinase/adenosylcobinamide-phosphate guanylyltransferase